MLEDLNEAADGIGALRELALDNAVPPAFTFAPMPGAPKPVPDAAVPAPRRERPAARPSSDEELAFATVRDLGRLLRAKKVSSTELTKLYLSRLAKYDPVLSCAVTVTSELALAQAKRADEELAAGKDRGPLHGIPWGAKDLIAVPGYRTTWGSVPFKDADEAGDGHGLPQARGGGRRSRRQDRRRRAGVGRRLVRRDDEEPVEGRPGLERLLGRLGVGDGGRPRRLRPRDGDAREHRLSLHALRRHGPPADVRPRQPARRDGPRLDDGQGRPDRPLGRGLRPRLLGDRGPGRPRPVLRRRPAGLAAAPEPLGPDDRLRGGALRGGSRQGREDGGGEGPRRRMAADRPAEPRRPPAARGPARSAEAPVEDPGRPPLAHPDGRGGRPPSTRSSATAA